MATPMITRFARTTAAADVAAAMLRDGCAVIEDLANPVTMDALERELAPHIAITPKGDGDIMGFETKRTAGLMGKSRAAGGLATSPSCSTSSTPFSAPIATASRSCRPRPYPSSPARRCSRCTANDGMYPFQHPNPRECIVATYGR